jgi:hypothetical protein
MGRDPRYQVMMMRELAACAGRDMSKEEALRELGYAGYPGLEEDSEDEQS